MNLYIDESGSINNHTPNNKYFVIALIHPTDKDRLKRTYKRFVSSNHDNLLALDQDKPHPITGKIVKKGGKMFQNGSFHELKGSQFDRKMKQQFVDFFVGNHLLKYITLKLQTNCLRINFVKIPHVFLTIHSNSQSSTSSAKLSFQMKTVLFSWMSAMKEPKQNTSLKTISIRNSS